jgi:transcription elongation GreA/GreB family factor
LENELDGDDLRGIIPRSPLGQDLIGKTAGQRWTTKAGSATARYRIHSVS